MVLERHLKSISDKSGKSVSEVSSLVEDLADQGYSAAEIHRFLTKDTAPNQHDTNPRAQKKLVEGRKKFYDRYGE